MGHMTKRNTAPGDPTGEETTIRQPGFPDPLEPEAQTTSLPAVPATPEAPETSSVATGETTAEPEPDRKDKAGKKIQDPPEKIRSSVAGSTWVALIVGLLILILLIVFILQNQQQVELNLFAWSFQFPAGIGYLITAIAGGLIVAMVGMVRMIELRRQVKKARRQHH